jgi:hypothetical protein
VKLFKTKTRTYKGKDYFKWSMNPPQELIEELGWDSGDELTAEVKGNSLVVRRGQ